MRRLIRDTLKTAIKYIEIDRLKKMSPGFVDLNFNLIYLLFLVRIMFEGQNKWTCML